MIMKLLDKKTFSPGAKVKAYEPIDGLEDDRIYFIRSLSGDYAVISNSLMNQKGSYTLEKEVEIRRLTLC